MSANVGKRDFHFDCIVERPRGAPSGGRYAIILALLLAVVAIAAVCPVTRARLQEAGAPAVVVAT